MPFCDFCRQEKDAVYKRDEPLKRLRRGNFEDLINECSDCQEKWKREKDERRKKKNRKRIEKENEPRRTEKS